MRVFHTLEPKESVQESLGITKERSDKIISLCKPIMDKLRRDEIKSSVAIQLMSEHCETVEELASVCYSIGYKYCEHLYKQE